MQLLEHLYGAKNKIKILRFLSKHKNWEFNITEIARDMEINKGIVSVIIAELEKENIVKTNRKGNVLLFKLNMENRLVRQLLLPVFKNESEFYSEILNEFVGKIKSKKGILSILVYGSVAEGRATPSSDVDILLVTESKDAGDKIRECIDEIIRDIFENGILMRADVMTVSELRQAYLRREPWLTSVLNKSKNIYGKELKSVIK